MGFDAKRAYEILLELYAEQEKIQLSYEIVENKEETPKEKSA